MITLKKNVMLCIMATTMLMSTQVPAYASSSEVNELTTSPSIVQQIETEVSEGEIPFNPNITPEKPYLGPENELTFSTRAIVGFLTKVTGISSGSSLNVRSKPSTSGSIVGSLKNGTSVTMSLYRQGNSGGYWWRYIEATDSSGNTVTGYVVENYLASNVHMHPAGSPFAGECTRNDCY